MDTFSYPSYPDSRGSSPRSRDIDNESQLFDEQQPPPPTTVAASYKVKLMCSYGGKIQPRPHDNQLAYIGGDTKILAVDRGIKFSTIIAKLSSLCGADDTVSVKYQLPGEDLDALISVTNDEDLEHMMIEYDRLHYLYRGSGGVSAKPVRLRLFLFPLNPSLPPMSLTAENEPKSEQQWFVNALNSVSSLDPSPPPAAAAVPQDFLFGLDKAYVAAPEPKFQDLAPPLPVKDSSDCGSEDRHVIGDPPVVSPSEIQRQIQELQRLQIDNKVQEKLAPPPPAGAVPLPVAMQMPYTFPERHMITPEQQQQQQVYIIPAPAGGLYQAQPGMKPVTGPVGGQAYYGVPRMVQEVYRDQPVYNATPKAGLYAEGIPVGHSRAGVSEAGYVHLGYDGAGRQVLGMPQQYQPVMAPVAVERRQSGGGTNQ